MRTMTIALMALSLAFLTFGCSSDGGGGSGTGSADGTGSGSADGTGSGSASDTSGTSSDDAGTSGDDTGTTPDPGDAGTTPIPEDGGTTPDPGDGGPTPNPGDTTIEPTPVDATVDPVPEDAGTPEPIEDAGGGCDPACDEGDMCVDGTCVEALAGLDCAEILECLSGCDEEEACAQACLLAATPEAALAFSSFITCGEEHTCNFESMCLAENCATESVSCFWGPETGEATCMDILDCMEQEGDLVACINDGTEDAKATFYGLTVCLDTACAGSADPNCQADSFATGGACEAYWQSCQGLTVCTPDCDGKECGNDGCGGECGTCTDTQWCVNAECLEQGGCVANCAGKSCGDDGCGGSCGECAPGDVCKANDQCGPPSTGTANCMDTYNCVGQCGFEQTCADACTAEASDEALAELDVLSACQAECATQDMSCLMDDCILALAECAYDAHGTGTCLGMFTCLQSCGPTDTDCQFACIDLGSLESQAQFLAIQLCLQVECPNQDDTCVQTVTSFGGACEGYVNACFGS